MREGERWRRERERYRERGDGGERMREGDSEGESGERD